MKFVDILVENSDLKESKLLQAANKAYNKPDTGITIQNKGAYNVIKDCANITLKYLPHYIFGSYVNPFSALKGKFKKPDIEEFVKLIGVPTQTFVVFVEKSAIGAWESPKKLTKTKIKVLIHCFIKLFSCERKIKIQKTSELHFLTNET